MKNNTTNSRRILLWSITVALAGFLFGFDTVVISGADLALQELWGRGEIFHGFVIMASALWGTVVGALFGNIPTDRFGRKQTLFWIGILYFTSALGSALANDPWTFAVFRFLGGIGVGVSTIAAPAYVSEIAPPNDRGKLVALYQFNIVFGILIAFVSNFLLSGIAINAWRWMVGVEAIPALIYTLMVLKVPRSPRWLLIKKGDRPEAERVMQLIDPGMDTDAVVSDILSTDSQQVGRARLFSRKYLFPIFLAFCIAFFNQLSGINAFLYYAPRIFENAGLGSSAALLSSIGIGVTNMIFTLVGLSLIDRLGRKQLMYIGSIGYVISLSLVAVAFYQNWDGTFIAIFLFIFIASHAIGQGTVIWVYISEIFPNEVRANGQSLGVSTHWVLAAVIPSLVPVLFVRIGAAPVFVFFAFMMVLQLIWVAAVMPETKKKSLEELEELLIKA